MPSPDVLLAIAHHWAVFALAALLVAECCLLQLPLQAHVVRLLGKVDLWYGIVAASVLGIGAARVAYANKGMDYYLGNPLFWAKIGVFFVIFLISLHPTVVFIRAARSLEQNMSLPATQQWLGARRAVMAEILLLLIILPLTAMVARGIGLHQVQLSLRMTSTL